MLRGKKAKKEEDANTTIVVEPTLERTPEPIEDDPIMEERDDAGKADLMEEERHPMSGDERSPVEEEAEEGSVMTEDPKADDVLSTVKEEPSKEEEADLLTTADETPVENVQVEDDKAMPSESVEDTLTYTVDGTADLGCPTPKSTPIFCGCFEA